MRVRGDYANRNEKINPEKVYGCNNNPHSLREGLLIYVYLGAVMLRNTDSGVFPDNVEELRNYLSVHLYVPIYVSIYMCLFICAYLYAYLYVPIYKYLFICLCICAYLYMPIYMCIWEQ